MKHPTISARIPIASVMIISIADSPAFFSTNGGFVMIHPFCNSSCYPCIEFLDQRILRYDLIRIRPNEPACKPKSILIRHGCVQPDIIC